MRGISLPTSLNPLYVVTGSIGALLFLLHIVSSSQQSVPLHSGHSHTEHMDHDSGQHTSSGNMMMMPMWFQWTVDTILWFHSWHPQHLVPYLGTVLLLFAFAMLHEALASYRVSFAKANSTAAAVAQGYLPVPSERLKERSQLQLRAINSLLYTANITTGYLLMLAVMSFNVGFFFAVVLGMGIGHFLFFTKPWHLDRPGVDACCESTVGLS